MHNADAVSLGCRPVAKRRRVAALQNAAGLRLPATSLKPDVETAALDSARSGGYSRLCPRRRLMGTVVFWSVLGLAGIIRLVIGLVIEAETPIVEEDEKGGE